MGDRGANTRAKTYLALVFSLEIAQNNHDVLVLDAIKDYFNELGAKAYLKHDFDLSSISEAKRLPTINRVIIKQRAVVISFMSLYPLLTRKALDYKD